MANTGESVPGKNGSFFRDNGQPSLLVTLIKYTIVPSIPLAIIAVLSTDYSLWRGNDTHHFYFELFAVFFAIIVAFYGLLRAKHTKDKFSLMIGLAYLTSAVIDALHASFSFNAANETLFLGYFIPQTWFAGRTFISSVMIIAILRYAMVANQQPAAREDSPDQTKRKGRQEFVSLSIITLTMITAAFLTVVSFFTILPSITVDYPLHRPYEIPPLIMFSVALFLFYKRGLYKTTDVFYKGILLSLLLDVFSQIVMSYSIIPFDTPHNVSHILKDSSYFTNIIALAMSGIQYNKMVKQNEEVIRDSYERLKAADKMKDDFINIAAHELRTPLQPIITYNDLALNGLVDKDEALKVIDRQAKRLQKLSSDILDVSRIESGNLPYKMEKIRINEVIMEVANSQRVNLRCGVDIQTQISATENLVIEADKSRLMQVFTNIINNAIKFTKEGYIRIKTKSSLELDSLSITISDSGPGISGDILPNLFGKFVTKSVGIENYQGTGLGLFISKAIVAAHNGSISAHNNKDRGATFEIALPITQNKKRIRNDS
jgi:signal transduction histidine kinase